FDTMDTRFDVADGRNGQMEERFAALDTRVASVRTDLSDQIQSMKTELTARFEHTTADLSAKVDRSEAQLGHRIDRAEAKLGHRIDRLDDRVFNLVAHITPDVESSERSTPNSAPNGLTA
ncbi:MAG: hypothetical protein KA158_07715, partial [Leucobacter sp.]|nr:hypothetical protein [Leucobacter sp.]